MLLALGALSAAAVPAAAQARFQITPFGGAMIFASELSDPFPASDPVYSAQTMNNSIAFGAHGGLRFGQFAVEATVAYAPATMVTFEEDQPSDEVQLAVFSDQAVMILGANLLYYLPQSSPFIELFLTAGGGIKRYSEADPFGGWDDGESDPTFDVGAGFQLAVSPSMSVRIDLRDYISTFDPDVNGEELATKSQHDILLGFGLTFHPGG
jgi:hypothetical protein